MLQLFHQGQPIRKMTQRRKNLSDGLITTSIVPCVAIFSFSNTDEQSAIPSPLLNTNILYISILPQTSPLFLQHNSFKRKYILYNLQCLMKKSDFTFDTSWDKGRHLQYAE